MVWQVQNNCFCFQRNTYVFLTKASTEIHTFQRMWLSFKIQLVQRKAILHSFLTMHWNFPITASLSEKHVCVFLTKASNEIDTLSKNVIIFQSKAGTDKRNSAHTLTMLWHVPNNCFYIQRNIYGFYLNFPWN